MYHPSLCDVQDPVSIEYASPCEIPAREDQHSADGFMSWYGRQLGCRPILVGRPDSVRERSIDGLYRIGSMHIALEHSSVDSLTSERKDDNAFALVARAFDGVPVPRPGFTYYLSIPHGRATDHKTAKQLASTLRSWFSRVGASLDPNDFQKPGRVYADGETVYVHIERTGMAMFERVSIGRYSGHPDTDQQSQILLKVVPRKLEKLNEADAGVPVQRVLIVDWHGVGVPNMPGLHSALLKWKREGTVELCDEIWIVRRERAGFGRHQDTILCFLAYSANLDGSGDTDYFCRAWPPLPDLYRFRRLDWLTDMIPRVGTEPERSQIVDAYRHEKDRFTLVDQRGIRDWRREAEVMTANLHPEGILNPPGLGIDMTAEIARNAASVWRPPQ